MIYIILIIDPDIQNRGREGITDFTTLQERSTHTTNTRMGKWPRSDGRKAIV